MPQEDKPKPKRIDEIKRKPIVRTYESDVSNAMKKNKTSMVDIVMAERMAKKTKTSSVISIPEDSSIKVFSRGTKENLSSSTTERGETLGPKTKPTKHIDKEKILRKGLIGLIVVAILFLGYGMYSIFSVEDMEDGIEISTLNEVIFVNDRISLDITDLDKRKVMSKILDIKDEMDPTLGTIINVYPIKEVVLEEEGIISTQKIIIPALDFLLDIGIVLPVALERTLTGEFMFGFHMTGTVEPFFVLKVDSFENAFAGMMSWEDDMDNDFEFLIEERLKRSAVINATSSEEVIGLLDDFKDVIIKNRDVRVMKDKNGVNILMYSLPDRKTIVITTNENTLVEVLDRLSRAKFSR